MRWNLVIWVVLLLATMVVVAGCTTTVTTTIQTTTTPLPCSRATISTDVLMTYLPDPMQGWRLDLSDTGSYETGYGCNYTVADRQYIKGDYENIILLWIYDTNYDAENVESINEFTYGYVGQSANGYGLRTTVSGYPAYETAEYSNQWLRTTVNLGNGIFVIGSLQYNTSTSVRYPYINAVNLAALDALA